MSVWIKRNTPNHSSVLCHALKAQAQSNAQISWLLPHSVWNCFKCFEGEHSFISNSKQKSNESKKTMRAILNESGLKSKIKIIIRCCKDFLSSWDKTGKRGKMSRWCYKRNSPIMWGRSGPEAMTIDCNRRRMWSWLKLEKTFFCAIRKAQFIMKKIPENEEKWFSKGEYIHHGVTVKGSQMIDLRKNIMLWNRNTSPSMGWWKFLSIPDRVKYTSIHILQPSSSWTIPSSKNKGKRRRFFDFTKHFIYNLQ